MEEIAQAFTSRQNFWDILTYKNILLIACSWDITGHISAVAWRSLKILTRGERSCNFASNGAFGSVLVHSRTDFSPKMCLKNWKQKRQFEAHMTGFLRQIWPETDVMWSHGHMLSFEPTIAIFWDLSLWSPYCSFSVLLCNSLLSDYDAIRSHPC